MKRRTRDTRDQFDVLQLTRFERAPTNSIRDVKDAENLRIGSQGRRKPRNAGEEPGFIIIAPFQGIFFGIDDDGPARLEHFTRH